MSFVERVNILGEKTTEEEARETKLRRWQYYAEERRASIKSENATISSFEKTLTTLSSGALGLSITFIRFIAPENPTHKPILFIAWILFGVSLLEILLGFLLTRIAQVKYREMLDKQYENPSYSGKNWPGVMCDVLNWVSLATFIVGVSLFAIFVSYNL